MIRIAMVLVALPLVIALYAYAAYPVILWVISRFTRSRPVQQVANFPTVSVVVPAYNEEKQIRGAIEAVLAQDYPADRLQILILSDASTDATDEIVSEYSSRGVELLRMPERVGKTEAENAASSKLRGEIVVNTDSSIRLHPAAIRELVAPLSDPQIGVTSGRDVSLSPTQDTTNVTEAGYVNYEMWIRALETRTGGIVGASGSCYAIRSELHRLPIPTDLSRDFSAPLTARLHGLRAVSVDTAICYVPRTSSLRREFRRKVRTVARGMDTLYHRRALLDPFRYGVFAWKLFSHKVCRWLVPVAAIPAIASLMILALDHAPARAALLIGGAFTLLALSGVLWPDGKRMPRIISIPAFAAAANLAVVAGLWRAVGGHHDHIWEPTRRSA